MKNLILSILIFFSFQAFTQEIPKKAWKIIVHTSMNKADNYKSIGQFLINNDYTIEKSNTEFCTITTSIIPVKKSPATNIYNFVCKDGFVVITGTYNGNISYQMYGVKSESAPGKIENRGMVGSITKKSFDAMNELAEKIPNTKIEYIAE